MHAEAIYRNVVITGERYAGGLRKPTVDSFGLPPFLGRSQFQRKHFNHLIECLALRCIQEVIEDDDLVCEDDMGWNGDLEGDIRECWSYLGSLNLLRGISRRMLLAAGLLRHR